MIRVLLYWHCTSAVGRTVRPTLSQFYCTSRYPVLQTRLQEVRPAPSQGQRVEGGMGCPWGPCPCC